MLERLTHPRGLCGRKCSVALWCCINIDKRWNRKARSRLLSVACVMQKRLPRSLRNSIPSLSMASMVSETKLLVRTSTLVSAGRIWLSSCLSSLLLLRQMFVMTSADSGRVGDYSVPLVSSTALPWYQSI